MLEQLFRLAKVALAGPCPGCEKSPRALAGLCVQCRVESGMTGSWTRRSLRSGRRSTTVLALARYWRQPGDSLSPAARVLRAFKYAGNRAAGRALMAEMANCALPVQLEDNIVVVPVPLHPRRLRARGYNQSAWLARGLAKACRLRVSAEILHRHGDDDPQARLSGSLRRSRAGPHFRARAGRYHSPRVLLVDDVTTTGVTLTRAIDALEAVKIEVSVAIVLLVADRLDRREGAPVIERGP
jgi:ComF family protein